MTRGEVYIRTEDESYLVDKKTFFQIERVLFAVEKKSLRIEA
jgi:hypothetical protein